MLIVLFCKIIYHNAQRNYLDPWIFKWFINDKKDWKLNTINSNNMFVDRMSVGF